MKKIPPLTKKRRSLAEFTPDSLAAALYHREVEAFTNDSLEEDMRKIKLQQQNKNFQKKRS